MTVGELFVNIGVKGADKAFQALNSVKAGLLDVSGAGLAAKAAVIGTLYAVERLTIGAAKMGTNFTQFANFTGMSANALQKWQYAMMQSGVEADDTQKSIENVQNAMGKMLLNEGAPKGMNQLASMVGFDFARAKDTFYVMEKLREYLKQDKNVTRANEVASSFGLSPAMIQGLRTTQVDLDKISNSELLSDSRIDKLNRVNVAWMNFWRTLNLFKANVVSDYGVEGIKALQNSFKFLTDVVSNIKKLIDAFPILKAVAVAAALAIAVAFAPVTTSIAAIVLALDQIQKYREGKKTIIDSGKEFVKNYLNKDFKNYMSEHGGGESQWHPPMSMPNQPSNNNANTVNVKVDNHGVSGAEEIVDHLKTAINFGVRQLQTVSQGS